MVRELKKVAAILMLALMLATYETASASKATLEVKVTGYFPSGYKSKRQARTEGGKFDRYGNLLRTLQDYTEDSFVSCATDPEVIRSGTLFRIKEMPNVLFLACDVGSEINGREIDICVRSEKESYELPHKVTIVKEGYVNDTRRFKVRKLFTSQRIARSIQKISRIAYAYSRTWQSKISMARSFSSSLLSCANGSSGNGRRAVSMAIDSNRCDNWENTENQPQPHRNDRQGRRIEI